MALLAPFWARSRVIMFLCAGRLPSCAPRARVTRIPESKRGRKSHLRARSRARARRRGIRKDLPYISPVSLYLTVSRYIRTWILRTSPSSIGIDGSFASPSERWLVGSERERDPQHWSDGASLSSPGNWWLCARSCRPHAATRRFSATLRTRRAPVRRRTAHAPGRGSALTLTQNLGLIVVNTWAKSGVKT